MKADNTPTVTARRRDPSAKQRLRRQIGIKKHEEAQLAKANEALQEGLEAASGEDAPRADALAEPRPLGSKFKKRQINKTWLPTHLWHAKRAHMTPSQEPLWNFAFPIAPTEKSYRMTHRASSLRGCVAWDTSYMSTISVEGEESSLLEVCRFLGIPEAELVSNKGLNWRQGSRSWLGWVREPEGQDGWIAKVLIVWAGPAAAEAKKREIMIRVHPSAFPQLWQALLAINKLQEAQIVLKDLRYEIGSLEVIGPGAMEALVGIFQPLEAPEDHIDSPGTVAALFSQLATVTDSHSLPRGALLSFSIADPRLGSPHRKPGGSEPRTPSEELAGLLSAWPLDKQRVKGPFFEWKFRLNATKHLLTQKAIDRRKGRAPPGTQSSPLPTDRLIPILVLAQNHEKNVAFHGSWTILLPWKCVLSVWYPLMYYPLSNGGNARFGGLDQTKQMSFERELPWFPGDYPGTNAGWLWELAERAKRKAEWDKRPKGRRIEWSSLDLGKGRTGELGMGWACDWQYLLGAEVQSSKSKEKEAKEYPEQMPGPDTPSPARYLAQPHPSSSPDPRALTPILITLRSRGLSTTCARIYRLPTQDPALRAAWLALAKPAGRKSSQKLELPSGLRMLDPPNEGSDPDVDLDAPTSSARAALATSLLQGPVDPRQTPVQADDPSYPTVPDAVDLIGFVTTGNFSLVKGRGTAIGNIALAKMSQSNDEGPGAVDRKGELAMKGFCIIREAGSAVGRLARWEVARD